MTIPERTVMLIGPGGREHEISRQYEAHASVRQIIMVIGKGSHNTFVEYKRKKPIIAVQACDLKDKKAIVDIIRRYRPHHIEFCSDDSLATGAQDVLRNDYRVFAPSLAAAEVEHNKHWARRFMRRNFIPCPESHAFDSQAHAKRYATTIYTMNPQRRLYIKPHGLTGGRGAELVENLSEAIAAIERMKEFGKAGEIFLIEETLEGIEYSLFAISDGKTFRMFRRAVRDYKTVSRERKSRNTGSMGSVCPASVPYEEFWGDAKDIFHRAFEGLKNEGRPYVGILYAGVMIVRDSTGSWKMYVIEFNARWGDTEAQAFLPGVKNYVELVDCAVQGRLDEIEPIEDSLYRICVVGAAYGYPDSKEYMRVMGEEIFGIEDVLQIPGIRICGAGMEWREGPAHNRNRFFVRGGRVFNIIAESANRFTACALIETAKASIRTKDNAIFYRQI